MSKSDSTQQPQWYVIHTYSGYEKKVSDTIDQKAKNLQSLRDKILEVQIPIRTVREITDGKEREVTHKTYPGYVLVYMIYTDDVAYAIRSIRGVTGFLGSDPNKPIPLTAEEVAAMGVDLGTEVEINLAVGDSVRITGTTMDGFTGTVLSIDTDECTCEVLVSMFGQRTPAKLALENVRRMD